ncbi:MAG TPA: hybrid sensor histidine kinase/response regulator [Gammaproteobacteria bacterium]
MNDADQIAASTHMARRARASRRRSEADHRVLVLVGDGDDQELARSAADKAHAELRFVRDVPELARSIAAGAGAALLSDAVLDTGLAELRRVLDRQRKWSELPVIVLFTEDAPHAALAALEEFELHARVKLVLLHRPVPAVSLASALRSALKSRRRQYEVRDLLARLNKDVRLRDQYLAMLGHELRNPLNSIGYVAEIFSMAGDALAPEQTRWGAEVIGRQLRHLSRLLDQLLDVARVQRGKIRLEAVAVDLRAIARRSVETFDPAAKRRDFALFTPKHPVLVRGDPLRLTQIVESLLDNAFKYTEEGGRIRLAVCSGSEARLTVTDDGHGIKPSIVPYVFEPFFQDAAPHAAGSRGLGLGLAMADNLTRLHGGRISARSAGVGQGAEFEVCLPLAEAPTSEHEVPQAFARVLHLLVIEDDADSADALALLLKSLGHDVSVAYDGESAMHEIEEHDFDLVIVDIGLPDIGGEEVAERIRRQLGAHAPRLVALTGRAIPGDADVFDEFLLKPVRRDQVERLLAAV